LAHTKYYATKLMSVYSTASHSRHTKNQALLSHVSSFAGKFLRHKSSSTK